jgi:8-oxo-dGTP pyrophosphatase MutT (NUDIX family)
LPGGKSEPGETPEEIVTREVKEETNLDFVPGELFMTGYYNDRKMHRYLGAWSGKIVIQLAELSDYGWFSFEETHALPLAFDYRDVLVLLNNRKLI